MPRIGDNILTPFIKDSPGAVGAPSIPNTGAPITESELHGANTLSEAVGSSANERTSEILNLGSAVLSGVDRSLAHKQALAEEYKKQLTAKQNASFVSNYATNFNMDATDISNNIINDKTIAPEKKPDIIRKTLNDRAQIYQANVANQTNEMVAEGLKPELNNAITSWHNKASDNVQTENNIQAKDLQTNTLDRLVKSVNYPGGIDNLSKYFSNPDIHADLVNVNGPEGAQKIVDDTMYKAGMEMLHSTANNNPAKIDDLRKQLSAMHIPISSEDNQAIDNQVKATQAQNLQNRYYQQQTEGGNVHTMAGQTAAIDINSPTAPTQIKNSLQNAQDILKQQGFLPKRPTDKKALQDNPNIQYQNPEIIDTAHRTIATANSKVEEINKKTLGQLTRGTKEESENQKKTVTEEQAKQQQRYTTQGTAAQKEAQQYVDTIAKHTPWEGVLDSEKASGLKESYKVSSDEVDAYYNLASLYSKAAHDDTLPSSVLGGYQKLLSATRNRLINNKQEDRGFLNTGDIGGNLAKAQNEKVIQAYSQALSTTPSPLAQIINEYKGHEGSGYGLFMAARSLNYIEDFHNANKQYPNANQIRMYKDRLDTYWRSNTEQLRAKIEKLNGGE